MNECLATVQGDFYRCSRKPWKDGYCKQHHPDTVGERRKKAQEKLEQRIKETDRYKLREAEKRIRELEEQVELLKNGEWEGE